MITKIVSGGQTGADRGGLDAAIHCEIPHGGWCPKGRKAEDGVIPLKYHLTEMSSGDYLSRTKANVMDSDATVVFTYGAPAGGSLETITNARRQKKPCQEIDLRILTHAKAVEMIVGWLEGGKYLNDSEDDTARPPSNCVLNVAGIRESHGPGIGLAVYKIMVDVLIQVNPDCTKIYPFGIPTESKLKS